MQTKGQKKKQDECVAHVDYQPPLSCRLAHVFISSSSLKAVLTSLSIAAVVMMELYAWLLGSTPPTPMSLHSSQAMPVSSIRLAASIEAL